MSNFLTPISYAVDDDLDAYNNPGSESITDQEWSGEQNEEGVEPGLNWGENSQNDGLNVDNNPGSESMTDQDWNSEQNENGVEPRLSWGEGQSTKDSLAMPQNDSEQTVDSPIVSQNDENDNEEKSSIGLLNDIIWENEELAWEVEKTELDIAREILNQELIEDSKTYNNVTVNVKAFSWTFPEWTKLNITSIKKQSELNEIKQQIVDSDASNNIDEDTEIVAFDISFIYALSDGEEIEVQPKDWESVQVTFDYSRNKDLKAADKDDSQQIEIYHINDKDENGEKVEKWEEVVEKIEINEEKSDEVKNGVVIDAESFSYYTIVVQRAEENPTKTWVEWTDFLTISIARPEWLTNADWPVWFTIMDRNLWAITGAVLITEGSSNSRISGNKWSYWYRYQWWNNYGFIDWCWTDGCSDNVTNNATRTQVELVWSYSNSWYYTTSFVKLDDNWASTDDDTFWWWANDINYATTKWSLWMYWDDWNDRTLRQWPCPAWWHVPSMWEWSTLYYYWYRSNYGEDPEIYNNLYYIDCEDLVKTRAFSIYFKLPFAGYRDPWELGGTIVRQEVVGGYWSSSPHSDLNYVYKLSLSNSSSIFASNYTVKSDGYSVRCFKDSYVAPTPQSIEITYDPNGWAFSWKAVGETTVVTYTPGETYTPDINIQFPNKESEDMAAQSWWMFDWWYTTSVFADQTSVTEWTWFVDENTESQTVYAKWLPFNASEVVLWQTKFVISDRDLWATSVWGQWKYFQWWNNYGFWWSFWKRTWSKTLSNDYWPWNYYIYPDFYQATIVNSSQWIFRGFWDYSFNENLWWNTTKTDLARQWPCPIWYHIPSKEDWTSFMDAYNTWYTSEQSSCTDTNSDCLKQILNVPTWLWYIQPYAETKYNIEAWVKFYYDDPQYRSSTPITATYSSDRWRRFNAYNMNFNDMKVDNTPTNFWYSVRCFKNAPQPVEITYDPNGWAFSWKAVNETTVVTYTESDWIYTPDINIQFPNKVSNNMAVQSWWMFDWWYTTSVLADQTSATEWTWYVDENTESQTVYAKWLPFDDLPIEWTDYVIMDRNLWATSNDISDENSYGRYYQWWNNYGFDTTTSPWLYTGDTQVDASAYWPGNYYSSAIFILRSSSPYAWDTTDNDNLWWWVTDTNESKQWPCPVGYHIPINTEWEDIYHSLGIESNELGVNTLQTKLKLPLAGTRSRTDSKIGYKESRGYYLSSSRATVNHAYSLYFNSNSIDYKSKYDRSNAGSLRCLKDYHVVIFNSDGWTPIVSQQIEEWESAIQPNPAPTRANSTFDGWYIDRELTQPFNFSTIIVEDITLYAKWNCNKGTPILWDDGVRNCFYYEELPPIVWSDGTVYTLMDRNLWARVAWDPSVNAFDDNKASEYDTENDYYWYYYQHWNKYWFSNKTTSSSTNVIDEEITDVTENSTYYNVNWNKHQPWNSNTNLWWNVTDTEAARQWPCPADWHVPSYKEWSDIRKAWCSAYTGAENCSDWQQFAEALLLPTAGYRANTLSFGSRGTSGIYWCSTANSVGGTYGLRFSATAIEPSNYNVRSNGLTIRCLKNTYEVTFDTNEGSAISSRKISIWWKVVEPTQPTKNGYIFVAWYKEPSLTNQWNFDTDTVTQDITLYAKRRDSRCPEGYDNYDEDNNICFNADTSYGTAELYYWIDLSHTYSTSPHDENKIWIITIVNPSNSEESLTMMDMNLWATSLYVTWSSASSGDVMDGSFWELYQWWNNAPIKVATDVENKRAVYENYWPWNSFSGAIFRWWGSMVDYWSDNLHYDNLWWWSWDDKSWNNWWGINNWEIRQWPCPVGYHVPSIQEWNSALQWFAIGVNQWVSNAWWDSDLYFFSSQQKRQQFQDAFLLPRAGLRNYSSVSFNSRGDYGLYWTSSPSLVSSNNARYLDLNSSNVNAWLTRERSAWLSVRCFKDSPGAIEIKILTFDENGGDLLGATWTDWEGTLIQKVASGTKAQQPIDPIINKANATFFKWTTDKDGLNEAFNFSNSINSSTTLYAQYKCNSWYVDINGECLQQFTCDAGSYLPANTSACASCPAGKYCEWWMYIFNVSSDQWIWWDCNENTYSAWWASVATCTACPSGYSSTAWSTAKSSCTISCLANYRVDVADAQCTTECDVWYEHASHTVSAWSTSTACTARNITCSAGSYLRASDATCQSCPAGKYCEWWIWTYNGNDQWTTDCPNGYTSEGWAKAQNECYITVSGWKYLWTANWTTQTECAAWTYKEQHNVNYGSTSSCEACTAWNYCEAWATTPTACTTLWSNYTHSAVNSISKTACYMDVAAWSYKTSVNGNETTWCGAGKYSTSHTTNYGSEDNACSNIEAWCYGSSASSSCPAQCQWRTKYSAAWKSECSTVSAWYYTTWCDGDWNKCTGQSQCEAGNYCVNGVSNSCPSWYDSEDGASSCTDITFPLIEITTQPSTTCLSSKTLSATISDNAWVTSSKYAILDSSTCESSIDSTAIWKNYTSATDLTLDNEDYNDKYVCFKASDAAGNTSYLATNQITNIDTAGPWVPSLSTPANNTYTNNNKPTLTWTAWSIAWCSTLANYEIQICGDSSCNTVEQSNTSATNTTWTLTDSLSDGTYYWRVREKDGLNRYSDYTDTKSFVVDTLAPNISFENPVNQGPSIADDVAVDWDDATVKKWKYSDTNSCPTDSLVYDKTDSDSLNQTTEANNGKYICLYAEDALWNATQLASEYPINIDITAPTWWVFNINNNAEYTNSTAVILKTTCATDTWVWAVEVAYGNTTNPDNWTDCSSEINWTLTSWDGEKTVYMKFKDGLWNESAEITDTIILDTTAPTCKITWNPTSPTNSDVILTVDYLVEAHPLTAGYSWDNNTYSSTQTTTATSNRTYTAYVKDEAWNVWNCSETVTKIDKTAPEITINNPDTTPAQSKTITASKDKWTLYMTVREDNTCNNAIPSSNFVAYNSITFESENDNGKYVCYKAEDEAGNVTYKLSNPISWIDTTSPTITITQPNSSDWTLTKSVSATSSDGTLYYSINTDGTCTSATTLYSTTITFESESDNWKYVCFKAVDAAWNEKYERSAKIEKIDRTAPVLSERTPFNDGWYTSNQTYTFTYIDTWAGITEWQNTTVCTISTEWSTSTCEVTNTNVCDKLWNCNTADQTSYSIKLDKTQPECGTWTYQPTAQTNNNVTATLAGSTDATSWIKTAWWTCSLASNDATCEVIIEDNAWLTRVCTSASVNNIDKVKPEATLQAETSTLKTGTQTARLICSDNVWVSSYYWWISNNPSPTDYQDITLQTNYNTTKTVNEAWTYYLFCRDEAWNVSDPATQSYYSYEVHNMLNEVDKAEWTYNATNYPQSTTATYIAPAWTTITFTNVYTVPNYSLASQYKWYTTSDSGNPSTNSSITLSSNSSYYCWFDRVKYPLTLTKWVWIQAIYYKVNWANAYTDTTVSTTVDMKAWSDVNVYAEVSEWYTYNATSLANPIEWTDVQSAQTFEPAATLNTYTVKFYDEDWTTVLDTQIVNHGENAVYGGETPSKTKTQQYTYTFSNWYDAKIWGNVDDLSNVVSDRDVYARYGVTVNKYTVTFVDEDGTVLKVATEYEYGTPAADIEKPADPSKSADEQNTYTFAWWSPEIVDVIGDATYKATYNATSKWSNYSWWWGKWRSTSPIDVVKESVDSNTDIHNAADEKADTLSVDDKIGESSLEETWTENVNTVTSVVKGTETEVTIKTSVTSNNTKYTPEFNEAYSFAASNGITTKSNIEEAQMNTSLTRIQMAKMLSNFATNILWQQPDTTKTIKFEDVSDKRDVEYDNGVTLAYQLGIMWQNVKNNKFRPDDEVTRAEFVTALSRMIYGIEDWKWKVKYYEPHMTRMYNEWIINNTNPKMKEKRWYVMIMLMRTVK